MRRRLFTLLLCSLSLVGLTGCLSPVREVVPPPATSSPAASPSAHGPAELSVASFNIRLASIEETEPERTWQRRRPLVAETIINSGAAVVGLQEVSWGSDPERSQAQQTVQEINEHLDGSAWEATSGTKSSNALAWDSSRVQKLSGPRTASVNVVYTRGVPRTITWARFEDRDSGRQFVVGSTHWQHNQPDRASGEQRRREAAHLVADTLDEVSDQGDLPVVLTGDFNDADEMPGSPRGILTDRGYDSVHRQAGTGKGWNSHNNWDPSMHGKLDDRWMDGIYVSDDVEPESAGVMSVHKEDRRLPLPEPLPSDHQLVWADLRLSPHRAGH